MAICPVCGFDQLSDEPWADGSGSLEICPSCKVQFGYDDACGGDEARRREFYEARRVDWLAKGRATP